MFRGSGRIDNFVWPLSPEPYNLWMWNLYHGRQQRSALIRACWSTLTSTKDLKLHACEIEHVVWFLQQMASILSLAHYLTLSHSDRPYLLLLVSYRLARDMLAMHVTFDPMTCKQVLNDYKLVSNNPVLETLHLQSLSFPFFHSIFCFYIYSSCFLHFCMPVFLDL